MTIRQLPVNRLESLVPELVAQATLVLLVPATSDLNWAAEAAWSLARAAARGGRARGVTLVDGGVDQPRLHAPVAAANDEGLSDIFEYGVSMARIALRQPEPRLTLVPAGHGTLDIQELAAHPGWERIVARARGEDTLLLLFLPEAGVSSLAVKPEGIFVLAREGYDPGHGVYASVGEAAARGVPLLGVVAEARTSVAAPAPAPPPASKPSPLDVVREWTAAGTAPGAPGLVPGAAPARRPPWIWVWVLLLFWAAIFYQVIIKGPRQETAPPPETPAAPAAGAPPGGEVVRPESLPYGVEVSNWDALIAALRSADQLAARGLPSMVTRIGGEGEPAGFVVLVGPLATQFSADSLLASLRSTGVVEPDLGSVVEAPLSFRLSDWPSAADAHRERIRMIGLGIPAFVLAQGPGGLRLYAGAFATADEAEWLRSLLDVAGVAGHLEARVGFRP